MKGLRLVIPPFAPDQSGAAGVLCALPGLIVILDAGGCAGNICGFDEPRWFETRSAIFSAGLRDMDAILGRDDRLVEKIEKACRKIDAAFVAVIGTPVPAVIATDYRAVGRMIEKKTGLPVLMIDTDGTRYYDAGEKKAWKALAKKLAGDKGAGENAVGLLGLTPLSFDGACPEVLQKKIIEDIAKREDCDQVYLFGLSDNLDHMAGVRKNIVVSPSALAAAEYLKKRYGIPYEVWCDPDWFLDMEPVRRELEGREVRKILVVHQQVLARSIRDRLREWTRAQIDVASWFSLELPREEAGREILIREEDEWIDLVAREEYDLILCDDLLKRAVPDYRGLWQDLPHFALSGKK